MTKDQKLFRGLILADLYITKNNMDSDDKLIRLQAAYHAQQAIEKTIKLKAEIKGLDNLWGHNIIKLLQECDSKGVDIGVPKIIRKNARMYTSWEADCRYYPQKVVRKDSLKKAYQACMEWLNSGDTYVKTRKK